MENKELKFFYNIIDKYKKVHVVCSKVKYNFIIDLLNTFDNIDFSMTIKEKTFINNNNVPEIKLNKKNCKFNISNILFLKENEFNSDINLLMIYISLNIDTIFNGIIIDTNNFNILCMPLKKPLNTKFSILKNYTDNDITKEYKIYKLYDGSLLNLYYDGKEWCLSDINNITYNNKNIDIIDNNLNFSEYLIGTLKNNNINLNNLYKGYTYVIYIMYKNYNLSYGKNKIKFVKFIDNVKHNYGDLNENNISELNKLHELQIKQKCSMHAKSKYGLLLINKTNNNDNKLIEFSYYKKINKILHMPIKEYNGDINIKYIALRAIIKYKIPKNEIINNFTFLLRYYNYIHNEIDKIVSNYINIIYEFTPIDTPYKILINKIDRDIKNDKKINDLFYNSNIIQSDTNNLKSILKDYIMQTKYINDINNNILL